jgi:hypothetical protein
LTGVGPTKASSNPLITTNGSLGDQWINTTTGELFILKDATTNSNVWQGQEGSTVEPNLATVFDKFGDSSAIALYQLNGNATDTGGSYNGTTTNGAWSAGKFGNCFDTTSTAGLIDTNINGTITATIKTYSMWVNTSSSLSPQFMGNHNGTQQSDDIRFSVSANKFGFALIMDNGNSGSYSLTGTSTINDGSWHHIVITIAGLSSGSAVVMYVDGSQENSSSLNLSHHYNDSTDLAIGNAGVYGSGGSGTKYDQVRLFNRVLTSTEVTTLYTET